MDEQGFDLPGLNPTPKSLHHSGLAKVVQSIQKNLFLSLWGTKAITVINSLLFSLSPPLLPIHPLTQSYRHTIVGSFDICLQINSRPKICRLWPKAVK